MENVTQSVKNTVIRLDEDDTSIGHWNIGNIFYLITNLLSIKVFISSYFDPNEATMTVRKSYNDPNNQNAELPHYGSYEWTQMFPSNMSEGEMIKRFKFIFETHFKN